SFWSTDGFLAYCRRQHEEAPWELWLWNGREHYLVETLFDHWRALSAQKIRWIDNDPTIGVGYCFFG
ncbi:MAG: hypothetical protein AAF125_10490, partial [Chloroflexota bacterium]